MFETSNPETLSTKNRYCESLSVLLAACPLSAYNKPETHVVLYEKLQWSCPLSSLSPWYNDYCSPSSQNKSLLCTSSCNLFKTENPKICNLDISGVSLFQVKTAKKAFKKHYIWRNYISYLFLNSILIIIDYTNQHMVTYNVCFS